jgi:hypothetical protein
MTSNIEFDDLNVEQILQTMDNKKSEYILGLTTKKLKSFNHKVLKQLKLNKRTIKDFTRKIDGYKCVDELDEITYGKYVRWITLKDDPEQMKLTTGGIVCEIKIGNAGIQVTCKNFMNRYFKFILDECVVFQKLSAQEAVLMSALDQLDIEPY